jgi:hypothetical protein
MPEGVGPEAYGEQYMTAQFGGSSAPEPGMLALFALLTVMLFFGAVRMRAVKAR